MSTPRYICKKCRNKIIENVVTEHFREGLEKMITTPEQLKIPNVVSEIAEKEQMLKILKKELPTLKAKIDQAWDAKFNGDVDEEGFRDRYNPLRVRKEQIEKEIPRLECEIEVAKVIDINRDFLINEARSLSSLWDVLSNEEKGRMAKELIEKVVVGKDTLEFFIFYLSEFNKLGKDDRNLRG